MLILSDYLALFPPHTREKPRFMALASAVLSQAADLLSLVQSSYPSAWALDSAAGSQLDALGVLLDAPRPSASVPDEDYRFLLRNRIAVHGWNGTNETLRKVLSAAFPGMGVKLIDNQDGTVTPAVNGELPFPAEDLFPSPAGIRLITD